MPISSSDFLQEFFLLVPRDGLSFLLSEIRPKLLIVFGAGEPDGRDSDISYVRTPGTDIAMRIIPKITATLSIPHC